MPLFFFKLFQLSVDFPANLPTKIFNVQFADKSAEKFACTSASNTKSACKSIDNFKKKLKKQTLCEMTPT